MLRLFIILLLLCATSPAWATTYHVATTGNDTTGDGSLALPWLTIQKGMRALVAGDQLLIRAGTYSIGTYGNTAADTYGCQSGGCPTSWAAATVIENYPGEAVVLTGTFNMDGNVSTGGVGYVIVRSDVRSNFSITGYRVANTTHHVRFQTTLVRDNVSHGIVGAGCVTVPANIEIIDNEIRGHGSTGGNQQHGIYPSCSLNWLIERNYLHGNLDYGIHMYGAGGALIHTGAVVRYNLVIGRKTGATTTAACILMSQGSGNKVHNNVCGGQGTEAVKYQLGIQVSGTGTEIYNNTVYDTSAEGIEVTAAGVNVVVKNNILNTTPDPIRNLGTGSTGSNNHCSTADTWCSVTGEAGFATAGTDFSLAVGSTAIDAGVAIVGFPYNGSAPDIGAFESGGAPADVTPPPAPTRLQIQ